MSGSNVGAPGWLVEYKGWESIWRQKLSVGAVDGMMGEGANQRWTLLSLVTREMGGVARRAGREGAKGAM